jgi:hypothetical protein
VSENILLILDGLINLCLGVLLLLFPRGFLRTLGLPIAETPFYASILGAVLVGISLALFIERLSKRAGIRGLGLAGAVSINLTGGLVLALWLVLGDLGLHLQGYIFLWALVFILVVLSGVELIMHLKEADG